MKNIALLLFILSAGCAGVPRGVNPVDNFNLENYLGKWYEIARLDHSFERGLSRVTAEYSLRKDGGIRISNRGYSEKEKKWKQVEGQAYLAGAADRGYLKVSFFWPFYGSYVVFELDRDNYRHALVCGSSKSYLWILARTPEINKEIRDELVSKAAALGFKTEKLIFVDQR